MTLDDLITLLIKIRRVHPEAGDAGIWAYPNPSSTGERFSITYVGLDTKHKPPRIKFED